MMGQEGAGTSSYVAIDIQEAAGPSNCTVCRAPLDWVAVAPCGHREVCAACAARARFFEDDSRCRVCGAQCPTVLVTKADNATLLPPQPPSPPAFGAESLVAKYYWYHAGMGAYFDDLFQYQAMRKVCVVRSPLSADAVRLSSQPAGSLNVSNPAGAARTQQPADDDPEPCSWVGLFFLYIAVSLMLLTMFGILFVTAEHRYEKVLAVLGFVILSSAFGACMVYTWCKSNSHPNNGVNRQ